MPSSPGGASGSTPLVGLHVDARVPAAQTPVPFPDGYRAFADVRLLSGHRLAAVLVDEPPKRIRDKPGAVVLMQMAAADGSPAVSQSSASKERWTRLKGVPSIPSIKPSM